MPSSGTSRGSPLSSWDGGGERGRRQPPVPYREGPLDYELPVFCDCKVKAARWISWSPHNPGRRYFTCYNARICFQGIDSFTSPFFVKSGGCGFWETIYEATVEAKPYMKQLLLDLRNAVWSAREQVNGLEAALWDRTVAQHNLQSTPKKESNEVQGLRAAVEKMEAANCVLVDRINKQQTSVLLESVIANWNECKIVVLFEMTVKNQVI
uniref:Zinc finger GRF-type domain-containing protein n=1 Tax=Oryza rufipogon TaxID=4529 RepID=A0A0E0Q7I7_ORYRU